MMLPTHALVGLAVGAPLLWLAPESATAALSQRRGELATCLFQLVTFRTI